MINEFKNILLKNGYNFVDKVYSLKDNDDKYTSNFSSQWRDFSKTQLDEFNNTKISRNLLKEVIFDEFENLKDKNILEIGCGPGRFTQYLSDYAKLLVVNDMSEAIYHNNYLSRDNVIPIKSDFLNLKKLNFQFDIVICRGVLQHTPDPYFSIEGLYNLCKKDGIIYFDIYRKPKIKILNPKYIWRKVFKIFSSYENLNLFLSKHIDKFLKIRRFLNKIFNKNLNYFWDYFFPIYDYKDILPLNDKQLREWAILDTLDGLITTYDNPLSYNEINLFLKKKNIPINKHNHKFSSYKVIKK